MEWKEIKGFENLYKVSDSGLVCNLLTNRILKGTVNNHGYRWIGLRKEMRSYQFAVHRLVAFAYIVNPDNKPQVNHKDGNKLNNAVSNLEWCTNIENQDYAVIHGLKQRGEKHISNVLTEKQVLEIRALYIPYVMSTGKLAKMYNVARNTVNAIVNRKSWKHL